MDTDLKERVDSGLAPLRTGLNADGADLQITSSGLTDIEVSLILTDETCQECIVPKDVMKTIITNIVAQVSPDIDVTYIDPRPGADDPETT